MANTHQRICGLFNPHLMADRSPGPLGRNDAADPNTKICLAGDTPGPVGTNGDKAGVDSPNKYKLTLRTWDLSLKGLAQFLRSVATNVALDKLTVVNGGVKLPDSGTGPFMTISNAIALAVTPGKTIETADPDALETEVAKVVAEYTQQLIASMNEGCSTTQAFLVGLEQKKVAAFNSMNKKFEEVQSYNNVKVEGIKAVLQGAIMIKFASTVVVKTGTKFLPPVVGFAIELGYDVLVETAKGIGGDSKASLMRVINEDAIEEYSENELKAGTKKVAGKVYGDVENLSKELSKLERQKMERRLSSKKLRNIDRRISRVKGSVDKAASKAKWAGRAVGWAFWADDMNDAWEELQRDLDAAK